MFSFRQKIFISYITAFFLFIAILFPFVNSTVDDIIRRSMIERADELIIQLQKAPDEEALVTELQNTKYKIFFRVGLYNEDRRIIYDTAGRRRMEGDYTERKIDHPEIEKAFNEGMGFHTTHSDISDGATVYFAKKFNFKGKWYVIRMSVLESFVSGFTRNFQVGFTILATGALLLFTIMTWFIINHLTSPIQQIIRAIRPYQEGQYPTIPKIKIRSTNPNDDFGRLAYTLNSLSDKIQSHINLLTNERNEKEVVLESLGEGVVAVNEDMVVTYANNMALRLLQVQRQDLVNKNFKVTNHPKLEALLQQCQEQERVLLDQLVLRLNGQKVYLEIVAAPSRSRMGAVLVMQDKTSHYRVLEMRKDFVANASHELKTPITIIRGYAETLSDNPDMPKEVTKEVTSKIVRNCERMTTLITDLLALSDIEHLAESRLSNCDLQQVINGCCHDLEEAYPTAKVKVEVEPDIDFTILADEELIAHAVTNLLENAAKYSTPPAEITISLKHLNNEIQMIVADKGIGIPKESLPNIFERFYTVDRMHSKKMGGSGLGLSLVETIIEKHFGRIAVDSEVGVGTTFTITLPVKRSEGH